MQVFGRGVRENRLKKTVNANQSHYVLKNNINANTGWAKINTKGLNGYNFAFVIQIFMRFIAFDRSHQNLDV